MNGGVHLAAERKGFENGRRRAGGRAGRPAESCGPHGGSATVWVVFCRSGIAFASRSCPLPVSCGSSADSAWGLASRRRGAWPPPRAAADRFAAHAGKRPADPPPARHASTNKAKAISKSLHEITSFGLPRAGSIVLYTTISPTRGGSILRNPRVYIPGPGQNAAGEIKDRAQSPGAPETAPPGRCGRRSGKSPTFRFGSSSPNRSEISPIGICRVSVGTGARSISHSSRTSSSVMFSPAARRSRNSRGRQIPDHF